MDPRISSEFRKIWRALDCKASCKSANNYKSYVAVLVQDADSAPYAFQVFENTLDVNVTFSYDSPGNYTVLFDKSIFNTPWDYVTLSGSFGDIAVGAVPVFFNALSIQTSNAGVPSDNLLGQYYPNILEVRVYN